MNLITSHNGTDRLSPPLSPVCFLIIQLKSSRLSRSSCSLSTYMGGWRCCGDGVFLIDTDRCAKQGCTDLARSEVVFKATFHYDAVSVEEIGRSVKCSYPFKPHCQSHLEHVAKSSSCISVRRGAVCAHPRVVTALFS